MNVGQQQEAQAGEYDREHVAAMEVWVVFGSREGQHEKQGFRHRHSPVSKVAEETACHCAELSALKSLVTLNTTEHPKTLQLSGCSAQD